MTIISGSFTNNRVANAPNPNVDEYFDNVVLLMNMDGSDDGTTFTDASSNQEFLTSEGSVTSIDQTKFGTAALFNDSLGDGVTVAGYNIITDNQASFTIEAFIYLLGDPYVGASIGAGGGSHPFVSQAYNGGGGETWLSVPNGTRKLRFYRSASVFGGAVVDMSGTTTINNDQWYHVALSYDAGTTTARLFLDGNLEATDSSIPDGGWPNSIENSNMLVFRVANAIVDAFPGFQQTLNGYIDELRVTQGVARYTANFTPPTAAFPAPYTSISIVESGLLLHLDPANATCFGPAETSATNLISSEAVTGAGTSDTVGSGPHTPDPDNFPEWVSYNGGIFDFITGRGMNVDEDLGTHTEFTLDMWYFKNDTSNEYLADGRNDGGTYFLTNFNLPPSYNLLYGGAAAYNFDVTYSASNTDFMDRWQHLVLTSDATGSKMYIDGTLRTLLVSTSVNENLGANYRIGQRYTNIYAEKWTGYMGPIKIYDRVLTASEALQNYNANKSRF